MEYARESYVFSTDLAVFTLQCPIHDSVNIAIDEERGLSELATDNVTSPSYEEQVQSATLLINIQTFLSF